ncbi:hypothetical protein H0H81_012033 [Sphagnurus paluster]|uniref:Carboxylic ester hydrolase n=1 Tax=Sphagnurus paluster TaxID=117069 RepID=A0A9P7K678_9AGAR|nr:hypothetical protein H0H81_012033 [Sphagnurus paluster]
MWPSHSLLAVAILLTASHAQTVSPPPIVDVGYAKYLGRRSYPNTIAYLGVPYAEPPLGERRFRAPVPLDTARVSREANGTVVDATDYPPFCIQGSTGNGDAGGAGSEDCLNLNIYTPSSANNKSNLPVLVYIHGGGYGFGNPATWPFDHWIHQSPNVVIASIYYRLSSFGFLAAPGLAESGLADLNAGFKDQVQALRWIQQHIAAFGGNPNKVTIDGVSAGGSSVELHLVSNQQERLFSGAIAQSVYRTSLPTPEQQETLFEFYAENAGCGNSTLPEKLTCLRSASVSALARAQDGAIFANAFLYLRFFPVIDNDLFTDYPTRSVKSGKFAPVPLMVGATTNETLLIGLGHDLLSAMQYLTPSITNADIAQLNEANFASEALQYQTLTGDVSLRCARSIMGRAFSEKTESWTYRYNQHSPVSPLPGVGHIAENWMMFNGTNPGYNGTTVFTPMDDIQRSFAEELIAYWLSFVRSGNPNTYKLARSPVWPTYTSKSPGRIVLQQAATSNKGSSGSGTEREEELETQRCDVVAGQVADQEN